MRRKNVFVVGNCQASAIASLYRNFVGLPNYESVTYFDDHMIAPEVTRAAVADADLIIVQDRDFNHGIAQEQLRPGATVVNFPMVLAGFLWPYANEAHVSNVPEPPFSDGPYPSQLSDSFLNRLIVKGVTPEQALEEYLSIDIARSAHLDRMSEIYFAKQRDRDARTGFDVAPAVESRFRSEALFRTPHHPNAPLFGVVAAQLFERLSVPTDTIEAALRSLRTTPFPPDELPIHPGVIRHFGLTFADENTRYSYFDEGRFTFAEYVLRYMRYENNYPLRLGIASADGGDPAEVLGLLQEGLARSPQSMRGWRARGIALDRLGRHAEACDAFRQAIEVDPVSPEGLIALSVSHRMAGEAEAALETAERAVALAPSYHLSHRALAEAQIASGAPCSDAAYAAVQLLPSAVNLHLLGLATAASGGLELAEDAARRLLAMDPLSPDARNLLAETLEDRSRRDEAIAVLNEGVGLGVENGQTFSLLGNFHWRNGDLAAAETAFARGAELEPARLDIVKCRDDVRAQRSTADEPAPAPEPEATTQHVPPPDVQQSAPSRAALPRPTAKRLRWLTQVEDWSARIGAIERMQTGDLDAWPAIMALAGHELDFIRTARLDKALLRLCGDAPPVNLTAAPVRLAVLASSTAEHLLPAIRVAAARHGIWLQTYLPDYGQFRQEIIDLSSGLHAFRPTAVLFALDAFHLLQGSDPAMNHASAGAFIDALLADLAGLWNAVRAAFQPQILHNTVLPVFTPLLGLNEQRLPGSAAALAARLDFALGEAADAAGVDLVAVDRWAAREGLAAWHDPVLWHRAKQEISPLATPVYGDLVARLLAAGQGRSGKCLVLDLDNTLWGGVIGDDGPEGIVIGQGSAAGEAFAAFQSYAAALSKRGVLLAACSKNDEANALAAFEQNPDMVLKRSDFSAFVANWDDKASNLREIARQLNIGIEALVFVDDNPFERNLVRRELPAVAVPEMPEDPALFAATISDGGYFEAVSLTEEDRARSNQYRANRARAEVAAEATDMAAYLQSLDMQLIWKPIDRAGVKRVTQLINKTNQFNLTTRRYSEEEVAGLIEHPEAIGLQLRLLDRFGDNGVIAVVIGFVRHEELTIDTWLMSCRVLGRDVERATLAIVAEEARRRGAHTIIGRYRPTSKNSMVADLFPRLGFEPAGKEGADELYRVASAISATDLPITIRKDD
jgi:FkbH-like protein